MITIIRTFLALVTFALIGMAPIASAQPAPAFDVIFESTPLFVNGNFNPADTMTKWVRVVNNSGGSRPVIFQAINISGCSSPASACLANKLRFQVWKGVTRLYDKSLKQFYDDGEVVIDTILDTTTLEYSLRISFEAGVDDNDFQLLSTGFDLLVGFQGAESFTSSGGSPAGLQIRGEATNVSSEEGGIVVTWATDYPATSQVIYGLASGGPYALNLSLPNYGYPLASLEDPAKVFSHSVTLTGLIPGETYRYRVVSHASPASVSYEHEFSVPDNPLFASGKADIPLSQTVTGTQPKSRFLVPADKIKVPLSDREHVGIREKTTASNHLALGNLFARGEVAGVAVSESKEGLYAQPNTRKEERPARREGILGIAAAALFALASISFLRRFSPV